MMAYEMVMPKMGESIMEGTILRWLKKEGDTVKQDETVLEIATDKVDSEVPSPVAGKILKLLAKEGDVVQVGTTIALIATSDEENVVPATQIEKEIQQTVENVAKQVVIPATNSVSNQNAPQAGSNRFYSPLVLNIAQTEGISMAELDSIPGTGAEGRVTKKDILDYVQLKKQGKTNSAPKTTTQTPIVDQKPQVSTQSPATGLSKSISGNVEIIEMDRMRKMIAEHMVKSKQTSPHVTSFIEVDVTNIVQWRDKVKNTFEKREGQKLTFTPIFIEAIAKAIKDFPLINVSVEGDKIIVKKDINIGMAVAIGEYGTGGLIVPVIKNADEKSLVGLAKAVNDLAERGRKNKLTPDDLAGGTFTLTNVGTFGSLMGTPIINQPQVAILATGTIKKKPVVLETPQGDVIGIRQMMFLSLSYDHRVVDGALGGSFLKRVADYLENFDINRIA
ncbi:MAG: 2-oxo acid dehydrogenase subunit E2 [Bacteroidia bacterium]|nr:2-oxo acid dehydrogenase subunit E2 [Bacteroidia bacterium]MDW8348026.1 dihydrolipoamide acetyltransferase family protein [Bacteroidia bacterium]